MKKSRKIYLSIGVATVILFIIGFSFYQKYSSRDFEEIKSSGVLRIATEYNSIGFFVSGDTIAGFQSDLVKLLEKRFKIKIETYPVMGLKESMQGLSQKRFEIGRAHV